MRTVGPWQWLYSNGQTVRCLWPAADNLQIEYIGMKCSYAMCMRVNTIILCSVLYLILLFSYTECHKKWQPVESERHSDRLMFLTGLVGSLCKVSPEIMDPTHAVKVKTVLIKQWQEIDTRPHCTTSRKTCPYFLNSWSYMDKIWYRKSPQKCRGTVSFIKTGTVKTVGYLQVSIHSI
jgi:hypothetical protein